MHFVREITKNQLTDGFADSFHNNTPEAEKALKSDIDRLFAALGPVKDGEEIAFTYLPDKGTSVVQAGTEKVTISGSAFAEMLFSVWLGPKPPNVGLKGFARSTLRSQLHRASIVIGDSATKPLSAAHRNRPRASL